MGFWKRCPHPETICRPLVQWQNGRLGSARWDTVRFVGHPSTTFFRQKLPDAPQAGQNAETSMSLNSTTRTPALEPRDGNRPFLPAVVISNLVTAQVLTGVDSPSRPLDLTLAFRKGPPSDRQRVSGGSAKVISPRSKLDITNLAGAPEASLFNGPHSRWVLWHHDRD
jgi:hypothetical protein